MFLLFKSETELMNYLVECAVCNFKPANRFDPDTDSWYELLSVEAESAKEAIHLMTQRICACADDGMEPDTGEKPVVFFRDSKTNRIKRAYHSFIAERIPSDIERRAKPILR